MWLLGFGKYLDLTPETKNNILIKYQALYIFKYIREFIYQVAGIACEAYYVFIPEWPPEENWPEQLCRKLSSAPVASRPPSAHSPSAS